MSPPSPRDLAVVAVPSIPDYVIPGFTDAPSLEPHLAFSLRSRLREELAFRDPPQPFPNDPLPHEKPAPVPLPAPAGTRVVRDLTSSSKVRAREKAMLAAKREDRYRQLQAQFEGARRIPSVAQPRSVIRVARGCKFDPALIEDRDYELAEVTGVNSRFHLRLVPWFAGSAPLTY